ncbi:bacillithiol biosynthesis cysteine-adding enzyme BshC [Ferroacidibacillus organovorans]|uniref:Putative cysteine ligase BshC n=1 Tax=Ferroacidibacillus organovorans TaxID=1765683 RepID=A0A117SXL4_9BACL|nr:bacillithiol biosynthesis cysteine-adding enzyme BshC [Ferroacidibacillus organovorans]KUO95551.1 hypothetical protein ATW55_06600 [Ferroacidibacillus organovorans]
MKLSRLRCRTGNDVTDAYLEGDARIRAFYDYGFDRDSLKRRALDVAKRYDESQRVLLLEAIREQQNDMTDIQRAQWERLRDPRALVVVTGQQAGLFTGPLYTIHKALSTVALARQMEQEMGVPVIPVFWVAAEDHDFDEVASAHYVTDEGTLRRVALKTRPVPRTPVGFHDVPAREMREMLERISADLRDGLYTADLVAGLNALHAEHSRMGTLFQKTLQAWLGEFPILVIDPTTRAMRRAAAASFAQVLDRPRVFRDAALAGAKRLRDASFKTQVDVSAEHSLLYLIQDRIRTPLDLCEQADALKMRDSGELIQIETLKERLRDEPEIFSAGVLYRPVVQDFLLPVLAYVGGAAEVSYHAMMGEIFREAGRTIPPLFLRQRVTLVPPSIVRSAKRLGLSWRDDVHAALRDKVAQSMNPPLSRVVDEMKQEIRELLGGRETYFDEVGHRARRDLQKTQATFLREIERLAARSERALRNKHKEHAALSERMTAWLEPKGGEQERILSPLSILAHFGTSWMHILAGLDATEMNDMIYLEITE